ncbi:MAG TPA: two-component regulator propeller domain-containing protein [Vicinamibacterales bacterium]|nr:two-component regulator propeller domain-containing protein [Vicinamibacterales bacterium]
MVQSSVRVALQDRRGFLWIGTNEGLSRFDGYRFVNYGTADGLGNLYINDIVEDAQGRLWVATNGGGVARLIDDPPPSTGAPETSPVGQGQPSPRFATYQIAASPPPASAVNDVVFDRTGRLWAATDNGLYRVDARGDGELRFEPVWALGRIVNPGFADRRGRLWFGVQSLGVISIDGDHIITYGTLDKTAEASDLPEAFDEDPQGTLRLTARSRVFELVDDNGGRRGRWVPAPVRSEAGQPSFNSIRSDPSGRLWIGTTAGLLLRENGAWRRISTAQGLPEGRLAPLLHDRDGNLWIAAHTALCRISPTAVISYTAAEGLPDPTVLGIFEANTEQIYVNTPKGFAEIRGDRAVVVPGSDVPPFRTLDRRVVRARSGDWWVLLDNGLIRFRGPQLQFHESVQRIPASLFSKRSLDGPGTSRVPGLYEDAAGRVLVSTSDAGLLWIDAKPGVDPVIEPVQSVPGVRVVPLMPALAGRDGTIWLSSMEQLARLRNGRTELVAATNGLPDTKVRSLYIDRRGRLWIGLRDSGVSMTRNPADDTPEFVNYSTRAGLASDAIWSITEDEFGRIYLATNRGLDRLNPETGRVRHFTTSDGLPSNYATYCMRDSRGYIWAGTINGLARIDPRAERGAPAPPPVYVTRLQIAGAEYPLPERGIEQASILGLPASAHQISLEYVGLSLGREHAFRYQYRLQGVDPDWSEPTDMRAVTYAQLSPGRFRFEARAIDAEGATSPHPAVVTLEILPPLWRRWWFLTAASFLLVAAAFLLHRLRLQHAIAMERIRRQVATDLHDDIGSGLSQIAILSEVAKRDLGKPHLDEIAGLARGMRESMDDIVWAVDPRSDRLTDLAERIRQVAYNALESDGMEVDLHMPAERELERVNLDAGTRRHVLLVAKEAITNIARHAGASRVEIRLEISRRSLRLTIRDNGRGFTADRSYEGQGLRSLPRRAAELGAQLQIQSTPAQGTVVTLHVPLR